MKHQANNCILTSAIGSQHQAPVSQGTRAASTTVKVACSIRAALAARAAAPTCS